MPTPVKVVLEMEIPCPEYTLGCHLTSSKKSERIRKEKRDSLREKSSLLSCSALFSLFFSCPDSFLLLCLLSPQYVHIMFEIDRHHSAHSFHFYSWSDIPTLTSFIVILTSSELLYSSHHHVLLTHLLPKSLDLWSQNCRHSKHNMNDSRRNGNYGNNDRYYDRNQDRNRQSSSSSSGGFSSNDSRRKGEHIPLEIPSSET